MDGQSAWFFKETADGRCEIAFRAETPHCHALTMASYAEVTKLHVGSWVVLWMHRWSVDSCMSVSVAIHAVQSWAGRVQLGIYCDEGTVPVHHWCPLVAEEYRDPLWLFFRDGRLTGQRVGCMNGSQLSDHVKNFLYKL